MLVGDEIRGLAGALHRATGGVELAFLVAELLREQANRRRKRSDRPAGQ